MDSKRYITDQKMLELFDILISNGKVKYYYEVCEAIGIQPQTMRNIRIGRQSFSAEHIRMMSKVYDVNLNYIYDFEDKIFNKKKVSKNVNGGRKMDLKSA